MAIFVKTKILNQLTDVFKSFMDRSTYFDRSKYLEELESEVNANCLELETEMALKDYLNQVRSALEKSWKAYEANRPTLEQYRVYFNTWFPLYREDSISQGIYDGEDDPVEWYNTRLSIANTFRTAVEEVLDSVVLLNDPTFAPISVPGIKRSDLLILCYAIDHLLDPHETQDELEKRIANGRSKPEKPINRSDIVKGICHVIRDARGKRFSPNTVYKKPEGGLRIDQHERVRDFLDSLSEVITDEINRIKVLNPDASEKFRSTDFWPQKSKR